MSPTGNKKKKKKKKKFYKLFIRITVSFLRKTSSFSLSLSISLSPLRLVGFKAFPPIRRFERAIFHAAPHSLSLSLSVSLILTRVTSRKEEISSHSLVSPYQHSPHSIDPRIKRARLEKGDGIISVGCRGLRGWVGGDCGGQVHDSWRVKFISMTESPRRVLDVDPNRVSRYVETRWCCYIIKNGQVMSPLSKIRRRVRVFVRRVINLE